MAQSRYYSSVAEKTTLVDAVDVSATSLTVGAIKGYPDSFPYTILVDRDTIDEEVMEVTGVSGDVFTVTRGVDGTPAVAHSVGAVVEHGTSARDYREARQHEGASQNVHGIEVGSDVVGTTDVQTLYNKTLVGAILDVDPDNPEIPMMGDVDMQGYRVMNLGDPQADLDAVSKKWVEDNTTQGVTDSEANAELAKDWAIKMDDTVDGVDYSSKWHAADAETSANDAAAAASDASDAWAEFASVYLGAHATPPLSNEAGQLYWNTSTSTMYVNDGSSWIAVDSSGHIASMEVDDLVVMSWADWQTFSGHTSRTLYVVTADPALDPDKAYGTFYLGTLQIGGAGGGQPIEGAPPAPVNVRWDSDDPAVSSYRTIRWDDGGMGDAGPAVGYGVLPANDAAKGVTVDQGGDQKNTYAIITGTEPGVTYEFEIFAANLAGPGERASVPARAFPGPLAPINFESTVANAFDLVWFHDLNSQVVEDGAVTSFEVKCSDPSVVVTVDPDVNAMKAVISPGTVVKEKDYTFNVRAISASGAGDWSADYTRQFVVPNAPYNVRVEGTTLLWEYDDVDTGPVTNWNLSQSHDAMSSPPDGGTPEPVSDATFGTVEVQP